MTAWTRNALFASALAVVAFWLLVPRPAEYVSWRERDWQDHPEIIAAIRGALELERQHTALDRRESRAIARAEIAEARRTGDLTITADPLVPAAVRAQFDSIARRELAIAGAVRVPIVVHLGVDTVKGHAYAYGRTVVLPRTADAPCGVTVVTPTNRLGILRFSDEDRLLGACAFYARYGRPGAGMERWLLETRQSSASYLTEPPSLAGDTAIVSLSQQYREVWTLRGCRAGDRHSCDLVLSPTRELEALLMPSELERQRNDAAWEFPDATVYYAGQLSDSYSRMTFGLLGALASDLGPERFERLWTSADPPPVAYEKAEGRPVSDWLIVRSERLLEPYRRGPGVPAGSWLVGVAVLAAAVFASTRMTRRQLT